MLGRTVLIAVCCIGGLPMFAQKDSSNNNTNSKQASAADTTFVRKAAEGGYAEVQLGTLAQQKASSQAVKDFGKKMVTDHTKANDDLKTIAGKDNLNAPTQMNAKDQALYDRLSKLSGNQFDREYMRAMVNDHKMDVSEFRRESERGKDADVRAFASKTLPVLEEHLKLAEQTNSSVGASAQK